MPDDTISTVIAIVYDEAARELCFAKLNPRVSGDAAALCLHAPGTYELVADAGPRVYTARQELIEKVRINETGEVRSVCLGRWIQSARCTRTRTAACNSGSCLRKRMEAITISPSGRAGTISRRSSREPESRVSLSRAHASAR